MPKGLKDVPCFARRDAPLGQDLVPQRGPEGHIKFNKKGEGATTLSCPPGPYGLKAPAIYAQRGPKGARVCASSHNVFAPKGHDIGPADTTLSCPF